MLSEKRSGELIQTKVLSAVSCCLLRLLYEVRCTRTFHLSKALLALDKTELIKGRNGRQKGVLSVFRWK